MWQSRDEVELVWQMGVDLTAYNVDPLLERTAYDRDTRAMVKTLMNFTTVKNQQCTDLVHSRVVSISWPVLLLT